MCIFAVILRSFMTEYTEGIVLHISRHTDRTHILHSYTQAHGRMQYLVYGLYGRKSQVHVAALEPLSWIGMEVQQVGSNQQIGTLKQVHPLYISKRPLSDICRKTVAIFLAEVLSRTLCLPLQDLQLFEYLKQLVQYLDTTPSPENLHLVFMLQFAQYLGFTPALEICDEVADVPLGEMLLCQDQPFFTQEEAILLRKLRKEHSLVLNRSVRQQLLRKLCSYYEFHIDGFRTPKSLDVLEEIFD